jgi:DNA invertase Pin-like site-specific DNA recombinase
MVLTVFADIAEFERALIRDRTGLGRIAAKKRGVKFGRKPKLTPEQIVLALRLVDEGQSVPQVAAGRAHTVKIDGPLGRRFQRRTDSSKPPWKGKVIVVKRFAGSLRNAK